jgi:hypothetical protein
MTAGFYLGRDVPYISTEPSDNQTAALKNATYAPNLAAAPTAGNDDPATSAREPIIPVVNGPPGVDNPQRQGLQSAAAGQGDPLPEIDGLRAAESSSTARRCASHPRNNHNLRTAGCLTRCAAQVTPAKTVSGRDALTAQARPSPRSVPAAPATPNRRRGHTPTQSAYTVVR